MHISAKADYAVRALLQLAQDTARPLTCESIASSQEIPFRFLKSVFGDLRRAGLVRGQRGVDGGYVLTRPPSDIMVGDVLRAVDGPLAEVRGVRPEEAMYSGTAEHLQQLWVAVRAAVRNVLDEVSLADVVRGRMPAHVRRLTTPPAAWQPR